MPKAYADPRAPEPKPGETYYKVFVDKNAGFDWLIGNEAHQARIDARRDAGEDVSEKSGLTEIFEEISPIEDFSQTMSLVRAAVAAGTPLLGVCRGLQEMNVALGGSLCQRLHAEPGFDDHREPEGVSTELQFAPRHEVLLDPGSAFAGWAGGTRARVNSLHGQGISRLASGLEALAHAPDGQIEAVVDGIRALRDVTLADYVIARPPAPGGGTCIAAAPPA